MSRKSHRLIPLLALAAALLLAACGGSHSSSKTLTGQVPSAQTGGPGGNGKHHKGKARHGKRGAKHRKKKKDTSLNAPAAKQAHGSSATFSPTATGRPQALSALAKAIPGARSPVTFSGGGDASSFTSDADQICTTYRKAVRTVAKNATNLLAQSDELQTLIDATGRALKAFQKLTPSSSQSSLAGRYVTLTGESVSNFVLAQARSSSKSESVGTAQETKDMQAANTSSHDAIAARKVAHQLGFHVCGSAGAVWL